MRKYAQINLSKNRVDLIGDESLGMPIEHPGIYTINIENHPQRDEIAMNMRYNRETDTFYWHVPEPTPEPEPTEEEIAQLDRDEMLLDQQLLLLDIQAALTKGGVANE